MSQEETDYAWLDEVLNNLVEDHIDIRGMDKESCNAWIDDYREAKTAIQAHLTAQAKQHQVELLQAQINEAEAAYDRMFNLGHRSSVYAQHEHLQVLQAELNKLESEG